MDHNLWERCAAQQLWKKLYSLSKVATAWYNSSWFGRCCYLITKLQQNFLKMRSLNILDRILFFPAFSRSGSSAYSASVPQILSIETGFTSETSVTSLWFPMREEHCTQLWFLITLGSRFGDAHTTEHIEVMWQQPKLISGWPLL